MPSGEDDLIGRYFKPIATDPGALGLADDAAILKVGGDDLVITTDAVVEGVHFLSGDPPETVARKALRVNLSDLAAKGATPAGFVMSLALRNADTSCRPREIPEAVLGHRAQDLVIVAAANHGFEANPALFHQSAGGVR